MAHFMGRPPIGKFTAVRLSSDTLARIDALCAKGKRADFIRGAVDQALDQAERNASLDPAALYAALTARGRTGQA